MHQQISDIKLFIQQTYKNQGKTRGVIAVSGGIDSALSLTLLCQAINPEHVHPLFLPYGEQSTEDAKTICTWNKIPEHNWRTVNIAPVVDVFCDTLFCHSGKGGDEEPCPESSNLDANSGSPMQARSASSSRMTNVRKGNIMARTRMIVVFDTAKELDALVCGTENKSEHYLGYFTRFGDSASDIEPICGLYKTDVREAVKELELPSVFLEKAPSAGLWAGQTDESEMGFSYQDADRALKVLLGESQEIVDPALLAKVKKVMDSQAFKLQVPYMMV